MDSREELRALHHALLVVSTGSQTDLAMLGEGYARMTLAEVSSRLHELLAIEIERLKREPFPSLLMQCSEINPVFLQQMQLNALMDGRDG